MNGLSFEVAPPVVAPVANRADIALFVGFVRRRAMPVPEPVWRWLVESRRVRPPRETEADGWLPAGLKPLFETRYHRAQQNGWVCKRKPGEPPAELLTVDAQTWDFAELERRLAAVEGIADPGARTVARKDLEGEVNARLLRAYSLEDLPVPVDTWEVFDEMFGWDDRPYSRRHGRVDTYLGAAVRSFFAQGGRKCYVVRLGDPWSLRAFTPTRRQGLARMLPGYPLSLAASPHERSTWRGIAHLFGLPDVALVCLPDLADACSDPPRLLTPEEELAAPPEGFVECGAEPPADREWTHVQRFDAPRCDDSGFETWALALRRVRDFLARQRRDVQLVAALPLAAPGALGAARRPAAAEPLEHLVENKWLSRQRLVDAEADTDTLSSAFVQLAYPWLRTDGSALLPGGLESPDGVLTGVLARCAAERGAFRSAARAPLFGVADAYPALRSDHLTPSGAPARDARSLADRVSMFARTPGGWQLASDVTTSSDDNYRPACVCRLVGSLLRTARDAGEAMTFDPSGEPLWARVRRRFEDLMTGYWLEGALKGERAEEAFEVRCDRSTMSQQDLDSGRVIASVSFAASLPIERIVVSLASNEGGAASAPAGFSATATGQI
jgi:hypothetical protein